MKYFGDLTVNAEDLVKVDLPFRNSIFLVYLKPEHSDLDRIAIFHGASSEGKNGKETLSLDEDIAVINHQGDLDSRVTMRLLSPKHERIESGERWSPEVKDEQTGYDLEVNYSLSTDKTSYILSKWTQNVGEHSFVTKEVISLDEKGYAAIPIEGNDGIIEKAKMYLNSLKTILGEKEVVDFLRKKRFLA